MKKLFLFLSVFLFAATGFAQSIPASYSATTPNYVVLSPYGTMGSLYYQLGQGYDSVSIGVSYTKGDTIPSGYMVFTQNLGQTTANKYTGVVVMPANPTIGQQVNIVNSKAFYHLFTTKPACLKIDTNGGGYYVEFVWDGKHWQMIN